jgi:hypothetical protein
LEKTILTDVKVKIISAQSNVYLTYDSKSFSARVVVIEQTDPALIRSWGKELHRLILTARSNNLKGTHLYTVEKE